MNRRKKAKRTAQLIRLWTLPEAQKAMPYLRSVVGSLREHWLQASQLRLQAKRLADKPGRPDRTALVARQEVVQDACRAEDAFNLALEELQKLDIFCLDPIQGLALIPFNQNNELAWFVFDLFAPDGGLNAWRFHSDPLEMRRPLEEATSQFPSKKVRK